ncbi:hypothetical protein Dsin_028613 [Dipteronia sinensis]|uniref:Uncharacterized protein n=1 Tax=Dipteronia sinensis TaxID=43782 RepID=A0AAD9ZS64_9ROSI|nr:hypothetical protein Dsin_028613 [Dipteronia sinensis]
MSLPQLVSMMAWMLGLLAIFVMRCSKTFDATFSMPQSPNLIVSSLSRERLEANLVASIKATRPIMVAWKPLCVGCVKLNVDGGCNVEFGVIYVGSVIRDHLRNWVRGYAMNMGVGNVLKAEL